MPFERENQIFGPGKSKRRSPMDSGNNSGKKGCCPMVAAVKSVKSRKFRLAARYTRMSARLLMARVS